MAHKIEQLQCAKMFMDYLANGVEPVSNTAADTNRLQNYRETVCGSECVFLPYLFRCDTAAVYGQKLHNRVRLGMAVTQ